MTETQARLLRVISDALTHYQVKEFVYVWEWETWTMPTHTIYMRDKAIHMAHDIYFEFGEKDLDALVEAGSLDKLMRVENKDGTEIKISYQLK